jgi:hypothetical protein
MEYIIQLNPQTLETLRAGRALQSDILPGAGDVRSYRIVVGEGKLPREAPPAPRELPPDPGGKPFPVRPANFTPPSIPADKPQPKPDAEDKPQEPPVPEKPWVPLTVTLLGLFASISANVFLGWIAWDFRQRLVLRH